MEINREIAKYFQQLPEDMIDQAIGFYKEGCACCVGAHLATYVWN